MEELSWECLYRLVVPVAESIDLCSFSLFLEKWLELMESLPLENMTLY